jgi:hypothetical protein
MVCIIAITLLLGKIIFYESGKAVKIASVQDCAQGSLNIIPLSILHITG